MIKLLGVLIVTATVYNAVPEQTDSTPVLNRIRIYNKP